MINVVKEAFGKHYPKHKKEDDNLDIGNNNKIKLVCPRFWLVRSPESFSVQNKYGDDKTLTPLYITNNPYGYDTIQSSIFDDAAIMEIKDREKWIINKARKLSYSYKEFIDCFMPINEHPDIAKWFILVEDDNSKTKHIFGNQSSDFSFQGETIPNYDDNTGKYGEMVASPAEVGCEFFRKIGNYWYPVFDIEKNLDESINEAFGKHYPKNIDDNKFIEIKESFAPQPIDESLILREAAQSNGVYSLKTGWVKVPEKEDIPDDIDLEPELSELVNKYNQCKTIDDIDNYIDNLYILRRKGLLSGGEYSKENQLFKEIRSMGYLDDLKQKKIDLENEEMSLK